MTERMQTFEYEARDDDGESVVGTVEAQSRDHAGQILSQRDLFVIRIGADEPPQRAGRASARATRREVAWQMWQLSVMVETGMRLSDALSCLARQASQPRLKALLERVGQDVQEGRSLSEAMAKFPQSFPSSLVALIRASELSGTLGVVLRRSAGYLMQDQKVLRRMRSALIYPLFMFIVCLAVSIFLLTVILPRFVAVFATRAATLPAPTRMLMAMSESLLNNWHAYLAGALLAAIGAMIWLRTSSGRRQFDYLLVSLPGISPLFNTLYQSRAFRAMSLLLETRVPLLDSMKVLQAIVSNACYRELWQDVEDQIEVGERFAGPLLASDLIPESVAQMIDNADRSGRLGPAFSLLAEFMEEEYDRRVTTTMQFIEPLMILLMGGIIAFVAVALMLPLVKASEVLAG